jgi:ribosome biogenesis protein Nip4
MNHIDEFIKKFTEKDIGKIIKEKNSYFLAREKVEFCWKKIGMPASRIGLCLGSEKNSRFIPSLALLSLLSKISGKKAIVNKKQEWLFTNGRDLATRGKTRFHEGLVLVQNCFDENIGLGEFQKKGIKNLIDVGDFLRREI